MKATGLPTATLPPSPPSAPVPTFQSAEVKIVNPAATAFTLAYFIDGQLHRLESGKAEDVEIGPNSTIEFGRGGDFGTAKYSLSAGTYTFGSGANGWELYEGNGVTVPPVATLPLTSR